MNDSRMLVLQAIVYLAHGEKDKALQHLGEALALAEPGGFIRIFVDEGALMQQLLSEAAADGIRPDYIAKLLVAFEQENASISDLSPAQSLIEAFSQRELEVLQLIAEGLSNDEISKRLFLALDTVKGHNRKILTNYRFKGVPKPWHVPVNWGCCNRNVSLPVSSTPQPYFHPR